MYTKYKSRDRELLNEYFGALLNYPPISTIFIWIYEVPYSLENEFEKQPELNTWATDLVGVKCHDIPQKGMEFIVLNIFTHHDCETYVKVMLHDQKDLEKYGAIIYLRFTRQRDVVSFFKEQKEKKDFTGAIH